MPWFIIDLRDKVFQRVTQNALEVPPRFVKIEATNEREVREFIKETTTSVYRGTWHSWRLSIEHDLTARFVKDGTHRTPARDVAAGVVTKATKALKKLHADGVSAKEAATVLYEDLTRQ
jgi:hypothetical protein